MTTSGGRRPDTGETADERDPSTVPEGIPLLDAETPHPEADRRELLIITGIGLALYGLYSIARASYIEM